MQRQLLCSFELWNYLTWNMRSKNESDSIDIWEIHRPKLLNTIIINLDTFSWRSIIICYFRLLSIISCTFIIFFSDHFLSWSRGRLKIASIFHFQDNDTICIYFTLPKPHCMRIHWYVVELKLQYLSWQWQKFDWNFQKTSGWNWKKNHKLCHTFQNYEVTKYYRTQDNFKKLKIGCRKWNKCLLVE